MSVYVDDMEAPYGRMKMCHMIADTREQLLFMVDQIGVERKWIQARGIPREHFVISKAKKRFAVAAGAKEVTMRELAGKLREREDVGWCPNHGRVCRWGCEVDCFLQEEGLEPEHTQEEMDALNRYANLEMGIDPMLADEDWGNK